MSALRPLRCQRLGLWTMLVDCSDCPACDWFAADVEAWSLFPSMTALLWYGLVAVKGMSFSARTQEKEKENENAGEGGCRRMEE